LGILSKLLVYSAGSVRGAAKTVATAEAALGRLADERKAASEEILSLLEKRQSLLLRDETDREITALDARCDELRVVTERLDAAQPILVGELQALRDQAKRERWTALVEKYDRAATEFAGKYRAVLEAYEALAQIRGEAQGGGFSAEAATFTVAPNILARDLLTRFESGLDRQRDAAAPRPAPRPPAPAPKPVVATPKPVQKAKPAPIAPAPKPAFQPVPDADGLVEFAFGLPGFPLPDGGVSKSGQIVKLPADVALNALGSAKGDYVGAL
jgi:hypothetical protein